MLKFYYNPAYKYTNRTIIDLTNDSNFREIDYENIDSPDTINGHIIYTLTTGESIPTYIHDSTTSFRWFVSGITQLRTGKYQISLLRDVISESNNWKTEQAYIEAGTATDFCKYKKWGLPFTNTKIGEQRLEINGKSSFFVFYVNEQEIDSHTHTLLETDLEINATSVPGFQTLDYTLNSLNEIPNYSYVGQTVRYIDPNTYSAYVIVSSTTSNNQQINIHYSPSYGYQGDNLRPFKSDTTLDVAADIYSLIYTSGGTNYIAGTKLKGCIETFTDNYYSNFSLTNKVPKTNVDALIQNYKDKLIAVSDGNGGYNYYTIRASQKVTNKKKLLLNADTQAINTAMEATPNAFACTNRGNYHYQFGYDEVETTFTLEQIKGGIPFDFNFSAGARKLPKSSVRCVNIVSDANHSDLDIGQALMLCMANPDNTDQLGRIIDIQYLPFQIADDLTDAGNTDFELGTNSYLTAAYVDNDDILITKTLSSLTNINKETDSVVIVSPSRKSQFMFSPYNNDGKMVFDFKATLRPNQSVMYIRPSTQGLLMYDWNDKECLIIQEDFSLTKMDSAWTEYVYNNRNYQNAFNLQMNTKEFERSWERRIEKVQAQSDTWKAREITAERVRLSSGNIPILSNVYAAAFSGFEDKQYMQAAQLDRQYNEAMYQKGLEVARTNFEYQIDNVKSQPLIPNTITAIDVKLLDGIYLEFYSTNETEKNGIELFYLHNGNRIDNYGTFQQYYGPFIRGKIIRSNSYTQPEIDEINRRLEMGIYTS